MASAINNKKKKKINSSMQLEFIAHNFFLNISLGDAINYQADSFQGCPIPAEPF